MRKSKISVISSAILLSSIIPVYVSAESVPVTSDKKVYPLNPNFTPSIVRSVQADAPVYTSTDALTEAVNQLDQMNRGDITLNVKFDYTDQSQLEGKYNQFVLDLQDALINNAKGGYSDVIYLSLPSTQDGYLDIAINYVGTPTATSATVSFTFHYVYRSTAEQDTFVFNKAKEIATDIAKTATTDFKKVAAVNEYITKNFEYSDLTKYNSTTNPEIHTVYGMLTNGHGVCQAYAGLGYLVLKELGLPAYYQTGTITGGELHAWNIVQVDGQWYNFDPTHNDPVGYKGNQTSYKYLLVSDTEMAKTRTRSHANLPTATSTKYEFLSADNYVGLTYNGSSFYASYNPSSTPDQNDFYEIYTLNVETPNAPTKIKDKDGNDIKGYKFFFYENRLLFIDAVDHKIKYWSPLTKEVTEVLNNNQPVVANNGGYLPSMYLEKDGKVYYHSAANTYSSFTLTIVETDAEAHVAAQSVSSLIETLDATVADFIVKYEEAQVAFNQLSAKAQGYVTSDKLTTLKASYDQAKFKAEATPVQNALATYAPFTTAFATTYDALQTQYNSLSAGAKSLVDNHVLTNLAPLRTAWDTKPLLWKTGELTSYEVAPTKEWTITFSESVSQDAANLQNVKVYNDEGSSVAVDVTAAPAGNALIVKPQSSYVNGETYLLVVEGDLLQADGKTPLDKEVWMKFQVQ